MQRALLFAIFWSIGFHASPADPLPVPPRLAVISDAGSKNLASLLTVELSANPTLVLVERDDLVKIGDEAKVQQMAGSDATALGKLANAAGLLFLDRRPDGTHVRFTAVNLGYALFDDAIPTGIDSQQEAKVLAHLLIDDAPKLRLDSAKAVPISVLNFREDVKSTSSTQLERNLTLLLESRLTTISEFVLLERRHAWSLEFERSLDSLSNPVLAGAWLIDGTLQQSRADGPDVTVHLRLQGPRTQVQEAVITGAKSDLVGLSEQLAAKIRQLIGNTTTLPPWQRSSEARQYLEEGIWAWQHGTPDEALEALDSAELLGETTGDLHTVRVSALCERAAQGLSQPDSEPPGPLPPNGRELDLRANDIFRALDENEQYSSGDLSMTSKGFAHDWGAVQKQLIVTATKLLILLDEDHSLRADDLRQAIRKVTHFDPLRGSPEASNWPDCCSYHVNLYADHWSASLAEEEAYYRQICAPMTWLPWDVLSRSGERFCPRFFETPEKQKRGFADFEQALEADPTTYSASLLFRSASTDQAIADPAFAAYIEILWKGRADAIRDRELPISWKNILSLPERVIHRNGSKLVPLVRYFLTHWNNADCYSDLHYLWRPEDWSEAEAAAIWPEYQQYVQRLESYWKLNGNILSSFQGYTSEGERAFKTRFPQIASSAATPLDNTASAPLVIRRFWHAWMAPSTPNSIPDAYHSWALSKDCLWLFTNFYKDDHIFRIHLPDLTTEVIKVPEDLIGQQVRVSPHALYLDYYNSKDQKHGLARYNFTTKMWEIRPIDASFMHYYCVGDQVYLDIRSIDLAKGGESGIARYDWTSDKLQILASSRRKPAQNQFDDQAGYDQIFNSSICDVFAGPGNRPCVVNGAGTFYLQETTGNWQTVFDTMEGSQALTLRDDTLVVSNDGEVTRLNPDDAKPDYLMAPITPIFRDGSSQKKSPSWQTQARWDAPAVAQFEADGYSRNNVGYHDGKFFVLRVSPGATSSFSLLVYSKKGGRTARSIPLQFKLEPGVREFLGQKYQKQNGPDWSVDSIEHPGKGLFFVNLISADQGICFHLYAGGVWFLPYPEIDDYLRTHASLLSESSP